MVGGNLPDRYFENTSEYREVELEPNTSYTLRIFSTAEEAQQPDGRTEQVVGRMWVSWAEPEDRYVEKNMLAGGLRVVKIIDKAGLGSESIAKEYKYSISGEGQTSSGYVVNGPINAYYQTTYPIEGSTDQNQPYTYYGPPCHFIARSSASTAQLAAVKGSSVGYEYVTVLNGEEGENGKILYKYSKQHDNGGHEISQTGTSPIGVWPNIYRKSTSYDWQRGLLLEQINFKLQDGISKKVYKLTNDYYIQPDCFLPCTTFHPNQKAVLGMSSYITKEETTGFAFERIPGEFFLSSHYYISSWYYLASKRETFYDQDNESKYIENFTQFGYANPLHAQLTSSRTGTSTGGVLVTELRYPLDYSVGNSSHAPAKAIKEMQEQHILEAIIEKQTWLEETSSSPKLVSAELSTYGITSSGAVLPEAVSVLEVTQPLTLNNSTVPSSSTFTRSYINTGEDFIRDPKYSTRLRYVYNEFNNVIEYTPEEGVPTTILWGYNNTYPVAEINNATYQQVLAVLGQTAIDELNDIPGSDEQLRQKLLALRSDSRLVDAQVTTYTYAPIVGRTSMTDSNGKITFYEYDSFGRLKVVKDPDGNVIRSYEYNYAGQ